MSEKITGVLVDIPTTIKDAKKYKERCEFLVNGSWLNPDAALCPFCEQWCGEEDAERLRKWDAENNQMRKRSEWISVAERLPELGKEVLWINKWGCMHVSSLSNYGIEWGDAGTVQTDVVTHWMLLPEPPKGEE